METDFVRKFRLKHMNILPPPIPRIKISCDFSALPDEIEKLRPVADVSIGVTGQANTNFTKIRNALRNIEQFGGIYINLDLSQVKGITEIEDDAFCDCGQIVSIKLPNTIKTIGDWAFSCTKISTIDLPESTTEIGYAAFLGCTALESIEIPKNVTTIKGMTFSECTGLKNVKLSNAVNKISSGAFSCCVSLDIIEIPKSVKWISNDAFSDCYATKIFQKENESKDIYTELQSIEYKTWQDWFRQKINETGKKPADVYKKAHISKQTFSKAMSRDSNSTKETILALAVGFELDIEDAKEFLDVAGYTFSKNKPTDIIVRNFICQKNYNISAINEELYKYNLPLLGDEKNT